MSYSIKDIEEWKKEYPLLKDIWTAYDDFDKDIGNDPKKHNYITVCNYFIKPWNEGKEEDKEFCMKLVRNLGHYSEHYNFLTYTYNSCLNLNNWIYNSMKKHNIRENIINKCFKEYDDTVKGMRENPTCFYYDYDKTYEEPMNIIMLNMFSSKIDVFKNILEGKIDLVHCSCQKFIKDVVSIYKYMKNTYCSNDRVMLNSKTCQELTSFERSYQFLYNNAVVKAKIPLLKYEKDVNLLGCESDISLQGRLSIETHKTQKHDKRTPAEEPGETSPPPQFDENNDSSNPMSPTVSTALGTVAGASSILALLYKFSPGRNWLRYGIRGGTGGISSNLYAEQPNEVFYDGFEGEVMSSYNPTYNVGYGSA